MPIVAPREILTAAHSSGYAIGAFNATNLMEIKCLQPYRAKGGQMGRAARLR